MKKATGDWKKAGENLVRHSGGTYYLRAKVAGKGKRVSLETSDLRTAKLKRDEMLASLRKAAASESPEGGITTLEDAIRLTAGQLVDRPHTKPATNDYYRDLIAILRRTLPVTTPARKWTSAEASAWWKSITKSYSAQRANNLLSVAKTMAGIIVDAGVRMDDPMAKLKRIRIVPRKLEVPSKEDMGRIVESIASQGKRASKQASLFVAFLAYSGCRHGEAQAALWEDVDDDWLTLTGGENGTKNREIRRIPVSEPLRQVLDSLRRPDAKGKVPIFSIRTPRIALDNACERLGLPHLRLHDLRHFFATWCIESGIDIPTVSKWLGHKDGGALAMKTYGHLRDEHSLASARKLS
ncbi:tyrosine-type recombinase/integrase [Luteolibacter marinus]|uniref:tyrosine-type recombinase/integrase n=1 Tax=Luteolibacter marinus TaxID=2776705 RepID=UPI0018678653|nr:site-specific integrase [Luteolibacter marinus]